MTARRRQRPRLADNTLLMGTLVLIAAAVVLYISYSAQSGLPWAPSYSVKIDVPDAGKVNKAAEVRVGGARVGQVLGIEAVPRRGEVPAHARLDVKLEGDAGPLPVDTTAEVRLASVLGGKYVALVPGRSERTIPEGGVLPLRNSSTTIDIEEAFGVFGPEGREDVRAAIGGMAGAVAGRGRAINETLATTARLMPGLQRVLATVSDDETDLPGFLRGAAAAGTALAEVSPQLGPFVQDAARTFGALDAAGDALGQSIEAFPPTARDTRDALRTLRPVLDDAAAVSRELMPAADVLPSATRRFAALARTSTQVAPQIGTLGGPFDRTFTSVGRFSANPSATGALEGLAGADLATFGTSAFVGLGAILNTAWEAEQHCRSTSTWAKRLADITADGDAGGNWLRMIPLLSLDQILPTAKPSSNLHANPYPIQNAEECEAGNEGYVGEQLIGNPPGRQGSPEAGR